MSSDIRFRNPYFSANSKSLYSQVKYDAIAASKVKTNGKVIAFPDVNGCGIGILELVNAGAAGSSTSPTPVAGTIKCNEHAPLVFGQSKQLQEFEFSSPKDNVLASSSRNDWLLRLWQTPEDLPNTPASKEVDTPYVMLAGHEKRIDLIKFHPLTSKIVATGSQDKTVRLWDIEAMQDKSCIALPGDSAAALSLAFDLRGDFINIATNDGNIYLYDPRTNSQAPAQSRLSPHLPIKGTRLCAVNPDPYFISSGFSKDGSSRIVSLFDFRMNEEVATLTIQENGPALLNPLADPALPIVYLTGKGESIRIFEVNNGTLLYNSHPKLNNQFVGIDLIPNPSLDRQKCEISRFVYLSNEKQFETTSIFIPRSQKNHTENSNASPTIQTDLYPVRNDEAITLIDSANSWFQSSSPTISDQQRMGRSRSGTKYSRDHLLPKQVSSVSPTDAPEITIQNSVDVLKVEEEEVAVENYSPLAVSVDPQYFGSHLSMEFKTWFSSTWELQWMVMRSTRLYRVSTKDDKLIPFAKYSLITKLKTCKVHDFEGKSRDIGFEFEFGGSVYRWRCESNTERNQWISKLRMVVPGASMTAKALPHLPPKQVILLVDSCVEIAELEKEKDKENGKIIWKKKSLALDGESMIHFYQPDLQNFTPDTPAEECLDLSTAYSVRAPTDSSTPTLTINTFKRAYHFRFQTESILKDWASAITSVIPDFQSKTMSVEGPVVVKYEGGVQAEWLVFANFTLFYFSSKYSLKPLEVVDARKIRFFGEQVDAYCTSEEPVLPTDPRIILSIDHCDETSHTFKTVSDYKFWVMSFDKIRRACWDLNSRIGLDSKDIDQVYIDYKEGTLPDDVVQYEEKAVVAGTKKFLFKMIDGSATAVFPRISSLRIDKAFVLDIGEKIYQWTGDQTSRFQRAEALNLATSIRKFRGSRPKLIIIDADDVAELQEFLAALGCTDTSQFMDVLKNEKKRRKISFTDNFSKIIVERQQIYRNTAADPKTMAFVYQGDSPSKQILQEGCIIRKKHEIFVWMCKGMGKEQKKRLLFTASKMAASIIQKYPYIFYAEEYQGRETPFFKSKFRDFPTDLPISMRIDEAKGNIARDIVVEKVDIQKLLSPYTRSTPEEFGKDMDVKVYLIKSFEKTLVPNAEYGCFCSTESYVISVTYATQASSLKKCILYFWQGSRSTIIEKGTCALISIEMSKEMQTEVKQVRVTEGKEPLEFNKIFKNPCLPILRRRQVKKYLEADPLIFEVRGSAQSSKAYQLDLIDLKVSQYPLVIITTSKTWVFAPSTATQIERDGAAWVGKVYGVAAGNAVKEVTEHDVSKYLKEQTNVDGWKFVAKELANSQPVRLFTCSSTTGNTKIDEVVDFVQDDLDDQTVMILDTLDTLYIWIGGRAKPNDQLSAIKAMQEYLELQKRTVNDLSTTFIATYPYQEPESFTRHFHGWTSEKFPKEKQGTLKVKTRPALEILQVLERKEYPKDLLLSEDPPEHVDRGHLELYLSAVDFEETFSMKKSDYEALPQWKQEKLKRQAGFY